MELKGAIAVVTGGSGGLGRRICHALAQAGSKVVVVYATRKEIAEKVCNDIITAGAKASIEQCDQTDPDQVETMVNNILKRYGRIDILVNDAAINKSFSFNDFANLPLDNWDDVMTANLTGPMLCSRAVAAIMQKQECGRIVNIASLAGLIPNGSSIPYCISKAGLIHLTRCLAVALAPHVLVNCVAPGFIEGTKATNNLTSERIDMVKEQAILKKAVDKDDIAEQVVTFCRSESTTGQVAVIDAGRHYH
jgi:3-oxoacyl-[acyl-carrier protein] reductase